MSRPESPGNPRHLERKEVASSEGWGLPRPSIPVLRKGGAEKTPKTRPRPQPPATRGTGASSWGRDSIGSMRDRYPAWQAPQVRPAPSPVSQMPCQVASDTPVWPRREAWPHPLWRCLPWVLGKQPLPCSGLRSPDFPTFRGCSLLEAHSSPPPALACPSSAPSKTALRKLIFPEGSALFFYFLRSQIVRVV